MKSTIIFERKSTYKPNYKIRVVKFKFEEVDNTIVYRIQILKRDSIIFEKELKSRTYSISKAKQLDDDFTFYNGNISRLN